MSGVARVGRLLSSFASEVERGPGWRLFALKAVLAGGLLSGFLLSPRLWLSSRWYPLSPIWDRLPHIPTPLDRVWFAALLVLLVGIAIIPRARLLVLLFLFLAALLSLWDQSRWQPWFYQYLFMLGAFAFCSWRTTPAETTQRETILNTCRFIMAAMYVWSGVQKANVSFLTEVYPWLLQPLLSGPARTLALSGGVLVPVVETAIGIALLVPVLRHGALLMVLAMHTVLLLCLGPLGHNWNSVVWPWNVAMMLMAGVLFWRTRDVPLRAIVWPGTSPYRWVVFVLFGIMPGLHLLDLWDAYLSASLYSGNVIKADLTISPAVYEQLPPAIQQYAELSDDRYALDLSAWSMGELNVPPYPARRIYRRVAASLCPCAAQPDDVILAIHGHPHWLTGVRLHTWEDCSTLSQGPDPARPRGRTPTRPARRLLYERDVVREDTLSLRTRLGWLRGCPDSGLTRILQQEDRRCRSTCTATGSPEFWCLGR